ncbi:ABC transporter ATP-binding protein [Mycoplasma seminis]|uniref:ABC transporter ATP-binding protein n=1 Tax=Mycoplasma seminis TaxID=512749 RepID=A0ABY9HAF7_9MOLU|nr:ABC transporter ATP-binding protein [Mycoplasma seminis]WLP85416.1 ABC transporter ATP-binding protein [Mycoplasma seminis]
MEEKYIIEIEHLNKSFKKQKALNDLSFKVKKGELFGFLGLNGAGKTTTLSIILGIIKKDSGTIKVEGVDLDSHQGKNIKNKIGIVFQESILDAKLSVYDNLMSRAAMYAKYIKDKTTQQLVDDVVADFELQDLLNKPYGSLSGGQRRRVDIARALVHKPEILFLDEPTTGLDPTSRKLVWKTLRRIQREKDLTILLTTHYMEEANNCNFAIIIQKGQKLAEGSPSDLKNAYSHAKLYVHQEPNSVLEDLFSSHNAKYKYADRKYTVKFKTYDQARDFVLKFGSILKDFELAKGNMDDVFLNVTNTQGGE